MKAYHGQTGRRMHCRFSSTLSGRYETTGAKKQKVSDMLEEEAKKMEDKLETVKKMMELEKSKRSTKTKEGGMWRSAAAAKPIRGYADKIVN